MAVGNSFQIVGAAKLKERPVLLTRTLEQGQGPGLRWQGPGPRLGCQGPGQGQGLESGFGNVVHKKL